MPIFKPKLGVSIFSEPNGINCRSNSGLIALKLGHGK